MAQVTDTIHHHPVNQGGCLTPIPSQHTHPWLGFRISETYWRAIFRKKRAMPSNAAWKGVFAAVMVFAIRLNNFLQACRNMLQRPDVNDQIIMLEWVPGCILHPPSSTKNVSYIAWRHGCLRKKWGESLWASKAWIVCKSLNEMP